MVDGVDNLPCFRDLIAVLFECLLIISLGYMSCRFKLVSNQSLDLNSYLTTFALPMIIFLNIAQMEFHTINLAFLFCMLTAKLLVFIIVTIFTLTISHPRNFGYAGSLSIMATQSNDFALGYPLIKSLYGESKPEMLSYLSLMAPIQLLILNPLGIAMLEYYKSKNAKKQDEQPRRRCSIDLGFLKALATNPLIIASAIALTVNLINGPQLPKFVTRVSNTIAASFASPALFVVGLSMYGKFGLLMKNPSDLLLASVLSLTKVLLLPNLMRTLTSIILPHYTTTDELPYLIDFSFLYGLLPTAPTACIIANQYGVLPNVVSISMLLSTFLSAPLMLASAIIISPGSGVSGAYIENVISQTMKLLSSVTLVLASLTFYRYYKSRKILNYTSFVSVPETALRTIQTRIQTSPIQVFLFLLALSQVMIGFGGFTWYFVGTVEHKSELMQLHSGHELVRATNISSTDVHPTLTSHNTIDANIFIPISSPHESTPFLESTESWSNPFNLDFGYKTLYTVQYVLSSSGVMMARFVVFSIILTMTITRYQGIIEATKISSLMVRTYTLLITVLVIWLIFDADWQKHIPVESILPDKSVSLYVRVIYNMIFLILSVPLFVMMIRWDNKQKALELIKSRQDNNDLVDNEVEGTTFVKRRFVTSSASLLSETSSALTTNTNIESTSIAINPSHDIINNNNNNNKIIQIASGSSPIFVDSSNPEVRKRSSSPTESVTIVPQATVYGPYGATSVDDRINNSVCSEIYSVQYDSHEDASSDTIPHQAVTKLHVDTEFNKYSVLVVFMFIDSILNLTSITQKLMQDQPFGTFRQIEVLNVVLEFGQGLLTFLIYGMR